MIRDPQPDLRLHKHDTLILDNEVYVVTDRDRTENFELADEHGEDRGTFHIDEVQRMIADAQLVTLARR